MIEARSTARNPCRVIGVLYGWMIVFASLPGLAVATPASPAGPTVAPLTAESEVEITFPEGIVISADLSWTGDEASAELELLYSVAGDETLTLVFLSDHIPGTGETVRVETAINLQSLAVPPGVPIEFRWRLVDDGETIAESEPERATWFDNRWDWNLIETDQVRVHYYGLDSGFANGILDSAQSTVTELEERYNLDRSAPLDVWIYPSSEDFRGAQLPNSRESIAGASYPGFFLITVVIPDGSESEIGRVIPHEVSHQVLYQATENPFTYPPLWFDEGLATHFQVGGTDGFLEMVQRALENGVLFELDSLEVSFPFKPAQVTLAYAASWSAIEYIQVTYGDEGIARLIEAFGSGVPYGDAIEAALGVGSEQLNDDWTTWIAGDPA